MPANQLPHVKVGREYRFDPETVVEHYVKLDTIELYEAYLRDPRLPKLVRKNLQDIIDGLRGGWLSVSQLYEILETA